MKIGGIDETPGGVNAVEIGVSNGAALTKLQRAVEIVEAAAEDLPFRRDQPRSNDGWSTSEAPERSFSSGFSELKPLSSEFYDCSRSAFSLWGQLLYNSYKLTSRQPAVRGVRSSVCRRACFPSCRFAV